MGVCPEKLSELSGRRIKCSQLYMAHAQKILCQYLNAETTASTPDEEEPPPPLPEKHVYADYSNIFGNDEAPLIPERANTLPRSLTHREKVSTLSF